MENYFKMSFLVLKIAKFMCNSSKWMQKNVKINFKPKTFALLPQHPVINNKNSPQTPINNRNFYHLPRAKDETR